MALRFAYADPPYVGCAHLYPEHPESAKSARAAARDAAWAAAWDAAWDAAWAALRPHVELLQTSAVDLYERMIAITPGSLNVPPTPTRPSA